MVDITEKASTVGDLIDAINRRNPGSFTFWKSLAADLRGVDNLGKPLELTDDQVQALSIATGVTMGVVAFWLMNNPEVIKTITEQMGKIGANLIPDISVTGGTA